MIGKVYFPWLTILLVVFVFRVLSQLIQWQFNLHFLPPFQAWQGSNLPYPILLTIQICFIVYFVWIILGVREDKFTASAWKYRLCLFGGGMYLLSMSFRLIAGQTFATEHSWFAKPLPAFFHIILASFVVLLGSYFAKLNDSKSADWMRD